MSLFFRGDTWSDTLSGEREVRASVEVWPELQPVFHCAQSDGLKLGEYDVKSKSFYSIGVSKNNW